MGKRKSTRFPRATNAGTCAKRTHFLEWPGRRSRSLACRTSKAGTDHLSGLMVCASWTQAAKASRDELLSSNNHQFWAVRRKELRKMLAQATTQPFLAVVAKWDGVW